MVSLCLWHVLEAERLKWSGKPLWTVLFGLSPKLPYRIWLWRGPSRRWLWRESLRKPSDQSLVDQSIWQFSTPVAEPAFCSGGESVVTWEKEEDYNIHIVGFPDSWCDSWSRFVRREACCERNQESSGAHHGYPHAIRRCLHQSQQAILCWRHTQGTTLRGGSIKPQWYTLWGQISRFGSRTQSFSSLLTECYDL